MYIHQLKDWPKFHWNTEKLAGPLASVRHRQGHLTGHMQALGFNLQQEAVLQTRLPRSNNIWLVFGCCSTGSGSGR
jgi:Fic family protein